MKKNARKLLSLLLVGMLVVSLAACGGGTANTAPPAASSPAVTTPADTSPPAPAPSTAPSAAPGTPSAPASSKDTLNVAVSLDSGTLDPMGITGAGGFLGVAATYMEPILDTDQNGNRIWLLATGIDRVTDTDYTVHIRQGVTFSNGNPLTADDVLFTFKKYASEPSRALNVQSLDLDNSKVIDPYTLDLRYTQFNAAQQIMLSAVLIYDAESYDANAISTHPVGTGAYVVTDYVVNSHVTLKARDDYWGGAPAIKTINFLVLNESSQVTNALETGMVDIANVPPADVDYVQSLGSYNVAKFNMGSDICAFYNMSDGAPLASKDARYAVSYAIDEQSIIDVVYNGYAATTDWPGSKALVDYEPRFGNQQDIYANPHNVEKAKQLAEETGLVGKTLTLITNGSEDYATIAQLIQNDLSTIGVNVDIRNYDQASFYGIISDVSNYDIALYFTASPSVMAADIFAAYLMFFSCGWTGPDQEAYMALGRQTVATADDKARSDLLLQLSQTLAEVSPWYGICDILTITAYSKDIQGLEENANVTGGIYYNKLTVA